MMDESALVCVLIGVGITAVLYVFGLSEYFENEVNKAIERKDELKKLCLQSDRISKAIQAQEWVFKWYAGRNQRFTLVWIPAIILFLVLLGFLQLLSNHTSLCFFHIIVGISTIGASICIGIQELKERKRSYLVFIPIIILIVSAFGFFLCFPCSHLLTLCVFYFMALLIPSFGAGIGMCKRPIAKYHEVILNLEELYQ